VPARTPTRKLRLSKVAWATASRTRGWVRRIIRSTSTRVRRSSRRMRSRACPVARSAWVLSVLRCFCSAFICRSRLVIPLSRVRRSEAQRTHLIAEALDVAELDLLVAANQVRQARDLDHPLVALRRQTDERLLDESAVLARELALDPSDCRKAEGVEWRAAQPLHPSEHAEDRREPRAELELLLEPERPEQRRVEVVGELDAAREFVGQRLGDVGIEREPRHLVLVLVGHELEEVARDRLGEPRLARHLRRLGLAHAPHELRVPTRVARALVGDQLGHTD